MSLRDKFKAAFKGGVEMSLSRTWGQERLPFGVAAVDAVSYGGPAEGRLHEIFGSWSTGKTMLLYQWLINCQKNGVVTFLCEAEGAFSPELFIDLGGRYDEKDPNGLILKPMETAEDFFTFVKKTADIAKGSNEPIAIGLDSLAALSTKWRMKEGVDKQDMGKKAAVLSRGTEYIKNIIRDSRIAIVATNQVRGGPNQQEWDDTHTPGGKAWPFYSSLRIELKRDGGPVGSQITYDETKDETGAKKKLKSYKIGRAVKGEVVKSKLGSPWGTFQLSIYTKAGFPHPLFEDAETKKGIDIEEALFSYYVSNTDAYFGQERHRFVEAGGAGRFKLSEEMFGSSNPFVERSFTKKQWLVVLDEVPSLRNPRALIEHYEASLPEEKVKPKPPPPPPKKKRTTKKKTKKKAKKKTTRKKRR